MKAKRPINLDLTTIKFPPAAIASLFHRISGVVVFLLIPILLWIASLSLSSINTFQQLHQYFIESVLLKFIIWALLVGLLYHLVAGIRHLLMDLGIGESKVAGQMSAYVVIGLGLIFAIVVGIWLWL